MLERDIGSLIARMGIHDCDRCIAHVVHKFERLRVQQREAGRQSEHLFKVLLGQAFRGEV